MAAPCLNAFNQKVLGTLAASPLMTLPAAALPATGHGNPDARLLAAFDTYCVAFRELRDAPITNTDRDNDPFYARMDAASDTMLREPAYTPAGIAAKLWVGVHHTWHEPMIDAAILGERELTADDIDALDYYQKLIWSALTDARRLAKATH